MGRNKEWVDTAFSFAFLGLRLRVTVLVCQDECDPAALGPYLHAELDHDCVAMVPMALASDYHV